MDKQIKEYAVISGNSGTVTEIVNGKVQRGWQPYGKLLVSGEGILREYAQVIVLYAETE